MSSCLVIEPVYPLLVRVNCEPRTRSLSIARALSPLANTPDPFLDTFPCEKNAALRANAHYSWTGSRFRCALRNWFRSLEGEGVDQPASREKPSQENPAGGEARVFFVSKTGVEDDDDLKTKKKTFICVSRGAEENYLFRLQ